jgi:hypothetical protein
VVGTEENTPTHNLVAELEVANKSNLLMTQIQGTGFFEALPILFYRRNSTPTPICTLPQFPPKKMRPHLDFRFYFFVPTLLLLEEIVKCCQ